MPRGGSRQVQLLVSVQSLPARLAYGTVSGDNHGPRTPDPHLCFQPRNVNRTFLTDKNLSDKQVKNIEAAFKKVMELSKITF